MDERTLELDQAKKRVHEAIVKLGDKVPREAIPRMEEAIAKVLVDKVSLREALGMTPEIMEVIYQQGYLFFQSGKYDDALLIFNILRSFDMTDSRFTFAIAACHQMKKEYLDAAANYIIYQEMDAFNPVPSFHLYDCFVKANMRPAAIFYLQQALILAGGDPKYASLKEQIQLEADSYHKVLQNEKEETVA